MVLFHLTTRDAWHAARELGEYRAPSLVHEGFIHLSTEQQWPATRGRFFRDVANLVLLVIDPAGLDVRFEPADGDLFPHLYGPLPIAAVVEVRDLDDSA